jgi:protein TonB
MVEAVYRSPSLRNPPAQYPSLAVERQWEGRVVLRVQVLAQGVAGQISVDHSSGHALLDDAAAQQVKNWHFIPARRGNQPVDSWVKVPIEFKLNR